MPPLRSFRVALILLAAGPAAAQSPTPVITTAHALRSLSLAEAQQGLTVRLRGVVVFIEPASVFVQDETSTAFFRPKELGALRPGDEIEVEGPSRMGLFLPGIGAGDFRLLGHRGLPPGIPATAEDIVTARHHYQRVEIRGLVRSVAAVDEGRSQLRLAMGSRVLEVRIDAPPDRARAPVGSRVRISGLAAGFINDRRQLVQPHVRVIDWSEIEILEPAGEPALVSAAELLAFRVTGREERPIRIQGTVTAAFTPGIAYLREGEAGLEVQVGADATLQPGDQVEVTGFPEMGRFSATVADALVTRRAPGPPLAPHEVGAPDRLEGRHDADLVAVTGRLTDAFRRDDGLVFILQGARRTIRARVPAAVPLPEPGASVRVVGVCRVESNENPPAGFSARPGTISLRARHADDVRVVQSPPWWTVRRLGGVLAGLVLLAGLWIVALRRQVGRQTAALRHRIETEAALEERHRIAREFHDSLEQELAGLSLRLDALATRPSDDKGRQLVAATRNLVSRIQTETRDLISDLRNPAETAGDLRAAVDALADRLSAESGATLRVVAPGPIPKLDPAIVHDLRMMVRELVHNALRHGRATNVMIVLSTRADRLVMSVVDNGCGFDPLTAAREPRGHFGCAGVRERGRKIGAKVTWQSALQKGTTVEVSLPLTGDSPSRPGAATASAGAPVAGATRG